MKLSSFYCLNCGKKSYDLPRKNGKMRKRFHRKKMYCPYCKLMINQVECYDDADAWEFKEAFEAGEFKEEAEESLNFIANEGI